MNKRTISTDEAKRIGAILSINWAEIDLDQFQRGIEVEFEHGALCFGVGMATFGYCPGTSVAACGEGRRDAMVGVLGMLAGAAVFVALFPKLEPIIKGLGDLGKVTLPDITNTSPWLWVGALVIGGATAWLLDRRAGGGAVSSANTLVN